MPPTRSPIYDDGAGGAQYTGLRRRGQRLGQHAVRRDFKHGKIDVFSGAWAKITPTGGFTDAAVAGGLLRPTTQVVEIGTTHVPRRHVMRSSASMERTIGAGLGVVNRLRSERTKALVAVVSLAASSTCPGALRLPARTSVRSATCCWSATSVTARSTRLDPVTGVFAGHAEHPVGTALTNAGLWGIAFGNGSQN